MTPWAAPPSTRHDAVLRAAVGRYLPFGRTGRTGRTGTSFVVDPHRRAVPVLLTNRVHPDADAGDTNPARRAAADALAG